MVAGVGDVCVLFFSEGANVRTICGMLAPVLVVFGGLSAARLSAATLTTIYSFSGSPSDGANPAGPVVIGPGGILYGLTGSGGRKCTGGPGCGTAHYLTPPTIAGGSWTETVYRFPASGKGGIYPEGGAVIGRGPVLYGATTYEAYAVRQLNAVHDLERLRGRDHRGYRQ